VGTSKATAGFINMIQNQFINVYKLAKHLLLTKTSGSKASKEIMHRTTTGNYNTSLQ